MPQRTCINPQTNLRQLTWMQLQLQSPPSWQSSQQSRKIAIAKINYDSNQIASTPVFQSLICLRIHFSILTGRVLHFRARKCLRKYFGWRKCSHHVIFYHSLCVAVPRKAFAFILCLWSQITKVPYVLTHVGQKKKRIYMTGLTVSHVSQLPGLEG